MGAESNENPITTYDKRNDFSICSEPYQNLGGYYFFRFTIAKQAPLTRNKNIEGGALYYCPCNIMAMFNGHVRVPEGNKQTQKIPNTYIFAHLYAD